MYSLAIGDRTYSSWSLRGWLLFKKFDIPVSILAAHLNTPEFTKLLSQFGGAKTVPALRIDAGENVLIWDSLAIAETLAERHPEKYLWPLNSAARGFARSITAEMHSGFSHLRNDCTMNLQHVYKGFQPTDRLRKDVARIEHIWSTARKQFGAAGPWLFGEYSIADAFFAPVATRFLTYGLDLNNLARSYLETTLSDPDFMEWRADGLAENCIQPGYDLVLETADWPDFAKC